MASIEKRTDAAGTASYRVKVRLKGYPVQSATFTRLTDARKWAQATEAAIREGRHFKTSEAKRHTLAEMIDRYVRDVLPGKSSSMQAQQARQLAWWRSQIGAYALADVTPPLLAEYRDRLAASPVASPVRRGEAKAEPNARRTQSPANVVRYLAALSHAFTVAVKEWGWVDDNPFRKVTKPKEPRGRVRFLSDDERVRLLAACKASTNPDLYPAVVLALSTGGRHMEIMGLRWPLVDLQRGVLRLEETKNGERRSLPLTGLALELMQARAKVRRLDTDLVFPRSKPVKPKSLTERDSKPAKPVDLRAPWLAALKTAGIEDFRWHDLRHSAASYLAMNGATLAEIAEVLGHKTLAMVKRYAHLSTDHTAGVVARMNAAVFGGGA